jgi:transposase
VHVIFLHFLIPILQKNFPEQWSIILSLSYFQAIEGKAFSKAEHWSLTHNHPYGTFIDNRRISELLPTITEKKRFSFFKKWTEKRLEKEYLAYDITSISSYSELNNMVRYGYNRDNENLPQINLAMLFGEETRLPVYYKTLPGSINDVSTLQNLLKRTSFLQMKKVRLVMDKGFYSKDNVNELFSKRVKFIIAVPFSNKFAREQVENVRERITKYDCFTKVNNQNLFHMSSLSKWEGKKRIYIHIFYNASTATVDYEAFLNKMTLWEEELKSGKLKKKNKIYYDKYFLINKTPKRGKRISYNQEAINDYKKNTAGYLVLLTNDIKDPIKTLKIYRNKDVVEKSFDNLKNNLDSKRLRVHLDENMQGRLFIQFISLILISYIRRVMNETDLLKFGSLSNLFEELELLNSIEISGNSERIISELTKKQKKILKTFNVDPKTYV